MIQLVAFDWNGTILADTAALVKGVNQTFKVLGYPPITVQDYQTHFDIPVRKMYAKLGIPEKEFNKNSTKAIEAFHITYEENASKLRTRENARKLLLWLQKEEIQCLIFSNHIKDKINFQLQRLRLSNYFATVLANDQKETAYKGRMKEVKLQKYMQSQEIKPVDVLVIGDTIEEIEIGKELGCITIAITGAGCSTTRLKASNPDFLISNLSGVISIIKSINKS